MAHLSLQEGTFTAAAAALGDRRSRKVGHNTYLNRQSEDVIAVRYHSTDVYTMTRDGWAIMRTGGWHTSTTAQRLNALLPGPWRVSFRHGLTYGGHPVIGFDEGLAVNVATGEVGVAGRWESAVRLVMPAASVAAAVALDEERQARRATARAARLAAQHAGDVGEDEVRRVGDRIAEAIEAGREPLALHLATWDAYVKSPHGRGRAWDCPKCNARSIIAREYQTRVLIAQHAHGLHVRTETDRTYPLKPAGEARYTGERDYTATPTVTERTVPACPWACPSRSSTF